MKELKHFGICAPKPRKDEQSKNKETNIKCKKCGNKLKDLGYYWCDNCGYEASYTERAREEGMKGFFK